MKVWLQRIWHDDRGFVTSTEVVLFATIIGIGMICGLTTIRDQLSTEFGDIANMMARLNQSYRYPAVTTDCGVVGGTIFRDRAGFCEPVLSDDAPPIWLGPVFIGGPATSEQ